MSLLLILLIVLLLSGGFGAYGHRAGWGPYGWSPAGIILIVILILLLSGRL
jgi:hypothetical protein